MELQNWKSWKRTFELEARSENVSKEYKNMAHIVQIGLCEAFLGPGMMC